VEFTSLATIGSGRATQAASSTGLDGVVGTTIGADLIDADGGSTPIPTRVRPPVAEVALTHDAQYAVIADQSRSELWMLGGSPRLVTAYESPVAADLSSDGTKLITASPSEVTTSTAATPDEHLVVVDAPPGSTFGQPATTADASMIAIPTYGATTDLTLYRPSTGAETFDVFSNELRRIVRTEWTVDGTRVIFSTSNGEPSGARLASWNTATEAVEWDVELGPLGLVAPWQVGTDGRVLLADETGLTLRNPDGTIETHLAFDDARSATAIQATTNGYAVALSDGHLVFVDLRGALAGPPIPTGQPLVDLNRLTGTAGVIGVTSAGDVASWTSDGDPIGGTTYFRAGRVNDVAVSDDDSRVAFASATGTVTVDGFMNEAQNPVTLAHPEGNVDSVEFVPGRTALVTGVGQRLSETAFDDTVSLWDPESGRRTATFGGEGEDVTDCGNFVNAVEFSPRGDLFAASSHDFTVNVHQGNSGELVQTLPPHRSTVLDIAFSPSGDRLVTASDDGSVRVWDMDDFELVAEYVGPPGGYWSLDFMPDGSTLVVSDVGGELRQIDVSTGTEIRTFTGLARRDAGLTVSPDGTLVAAAVDENQVGIWSTASGEMLGSASGHQAPVTSTAFSSDGLHLVTGSEDATVRVWRVD
jgi:hypothetical protein